MTGPIELYHILKIQYRNATLFNVIICCFLSNSNLLDSQQNCCVTLSLHKFCISLSAVDLFIVSWHKGRVLGYSFSGMSSCGSVKNKASG